MSANSPFDTTRFDDIGHTPEDVFSNKHKYTLEQMSPNEYLKMSASLFGTPVKNLIKQRRSVNNGMSIDEMKDRMSSGEKFGTPYIAHNPLNKKTIRNNQEGLHRMIAAGDLYGYDTKQPVYWVRNLDDETDFNKDVLPNLDSIVKKRIHNSRGRDYYYKKKGEKDRAEELATIAKEFNVTPEQVTPEMEEQYYDMLDKMFDTEEY